MKIRRFLMIGAAGVLFAAAALGSAYAAKAPLGQATQPAAVSAPAPAGTIATTGGQTAVEKEVADSAETAAEKAAETEDVESADTAADTDNVQHEAQGEETGENGSGVEASGAASAGR